MEFFFERLIIRRLGSNKKIAINIGSMNAMVQQAIGGLLVVDTYVITYNLNVPI